MTATAPHLGLGIGWRPELALTIDRRTDLGFVELMAEDFDSDRPLPSPMQRLRDRGVALVPHGLSLSLGGAEPPEPRRIDRLARLAERVNAPLVSEHIAFVRAGGIESGHLLPVSLTRAALEIVIENVRRVRDELPVPLALENIATLVRCPNGELDEADFLTELLDRTDTLLLLDVENLYANCRNFGDDPFAFFERLPRHRLAYVHVAGGVETAGVYHDTHTDPIPVEVLALVEELAARTVVPGIMLERDANFPPAGEIDLELDAISKAVVRGAQRSGANYGVR